MRTSAKLLSLSFMLATGSAFAECHWEWLCNGTGGCQQTPVCDSLYEVPGPHPDTPPPEPPPKSLRPQKIAGTLGPADCDYVMHQDASGIWRWDKACYCSDARKPRDTGTPLANMVRCDAPIAKNE